MPFASMLLNLLFPPKCAFCWKVLDRTGASYCAKCAVNLPFADDGDKQTGEYFDVCVSPLYFEGAVRDSIHRYKFRNAQHYADIYGKILSLCVAERLDMDYDFITWVPLSEKRLRERGYDQAMLLARSVAAELERPVIETLRKNIDTTPQSIVSGRQARGDNVSGAYSVVEPALVLGRSVLIIDDVSTTGATLDECSKMLLQSGAHKIMCASLASTQIVENT